MPLHPVVRRALLLLGGSYALAWAGISMTAGPGPGAVVALSGRLDFAGLFFAVFSLSAAAGAAIGGRIMDRVGRRPVLVAAHLLAAAGYLTMGASVAAGRLSTFLVGVVLFATAIGSIYLTRLAAADLFPAAARGRGMSWVLLAATGGALLGPALLVTADPITRATGFEPALAVWFVAAPLPVVAAALVALAPEPSRIARELDRYHPPAAAASPDAPRRVNASSPRAGRHLLAGAATLALAQMAMLMVMGVTGAALEHDGHGVGIMGIVMAAHFVGMFGFSAVAGAFADRAGRRATMLAGLSALALGGAVVATSPAWPVFTLGLFLVGVGWSFAYVGSTVLVMDVTPLERRARVLGRADFSASLLAAAGSGLGGWWFAAQGLAGLGLFAIAVVAIPLVLVLTLREPAAAAAAATLDADADAGDAAEARG